ncbi:hypothetical protein [Salinicola socius]|uniref:Molecular chaperone DnaJ n=1 Tax=Salinicola socius TaxID=404433 RepID=A0A1Q8SV03_9GAMM|nr:hypothetical protein [Salinicola socius]OLO05236.1 hypothetical protein BTW07_04195 [Salinicola socius]
MAKSKPLHWQEPTTENCPQCNGSGEFRGMFSSGPCAVCDGTGLVGENGEPLPVEDLLPMLRRQRDRIAGQIEAARQHYRQLLHTPGVREALAAEHERQQERQREKDMAFRKKLRGV